MLLEHVISGGQTGVDQVGLAIAHTLGLKTGGMAPRGYKTDDGPNPSLLRDRYGLVECAFAGYRIRTGVNVQQADATVWFGRHPSPGRTCTRNAADRYQRPYLENPSDIMLRLWLEEIQVKTLNVAGHRLRTHPEAAAEAHRVLLIVLTILIA